MKKTGKLLMTLVGAAAGFGLGMGLVVMLDRIPDLPEGTMIALYALSLLMLGAFFCIELVMHEAGHLLFGLLTGWRFVSFRIGSVLWLRGENGAIQRRKFSLAGTVGQCLMAPPPWQEKGFPCALYNMGGVIVNLATALVCGGLAWRLSAHPVASLLLAEAGAVGLLLGVTNGIPLPGLLAANDGSNMISLLKSRDARRALWIQMSIAAAQARGVRLTDMPEEWFAPFPDEAMDNPLVCSVAVFAANRLFDRHGDWADIRRAIAALLRREKGLLPLYRALLTLDGATCEMLCEGLPDDFTKALDTPAVRQVMKAMKRYPPVLRAQYVAALIRDRDEAMAAKYLEAFSRMAEDYPYPQDLYAERYAMTRAEEIAERLTNRESRKG